MSASRTYMYSAVPEQKTPFFRVGRKHRKATGAGASSTRSVDLVRSFVFLYTHVAHCPTKFASKFTGLEGPFFMEIAWANPRCPNRRYGGERIR